MEGTIYAIIIAYFVLGGLAFAFIARDKSREKKREIRTKYWTYFVIIHLLFAGIYFGPRYFFYICLIIALAGYAEIIKVGLQRRTRGLLIITSLALYTLLAVPFVLFGLSDKGSLYFVFVVVTVFDAFSQITGQIFGGSKLIPSVSPRKTVAGLAGGTLMALVTAIFVAGFIPGSRGLALVISGIIVIFALAGDLLASFFKRQNNVKDFSNLLPGHGGFLDRFDSLIPGGAAMYIINIFLS